MTNNLQKEEKLFIKISNNFGILLTVHKYIELKGLNKNMDLKHHNIHIYKNTGLNLEVHTL